MKYTLDFDADALKFSIALRLYDGHYWRIGQVCDYDGQYIWDVCIIDTRGNTVVRAGTKFDLPTFINDTWQKYKEEHG
jgi:hypothetical protein